MAEKEKIGTVFAYFNKAGVAGVKIETGSIELGDKILIQGHTTNFEQEIESMQINKKNIQKAKAGQEVGIKVNERARPNDVVYKLL